MIQNRKNDLLIGFIVSVLLSLFINFSLLSFNYERLMSGEERFPVNEIEQYMLYFSLIWFFSFSFILFIFNIQGYKLGEKLFKTAEYKSVLSVIFLCLLFLYTALQVHPAIKKLILSYPDIDVTTNRYKFENDSRFTLKTGSFTVQTNGNRAPKHFDQNINRIKKDIPRQEVVITTQMTPLPPFHIPMLTEHLFITFVVSLTVLLIRLLNSKQKMQLEYEQLKSEKLQTSYNALMGQINPHFFFNSLNGLSSLINTGDKEKTLTYLNELSEIFRYILQSNKREMVTLAEELQFTKAYTYLLSVRYEGKLFFSIQADKSCFLLTLPILSILPLIENAVKHNIISRQYPLQIDIYTNADNYLVVSNHIQPKSEDSTGNGIGLKNLWGRYQLLTGKDILISNRKEYFKVSLPLLNPSSNI